MWTRRDLHPLRQVPTLTCYCIQHGPVGPHINYTTEKALCEERTFLWYPTLARVYELYQRYVYNYILYYLLVKFGAWYHVAVTTATAFNASAVQLGTETSYFDGRLDDIRFYNYARTADQVKQDYNGGGAVKF